MKLRHILSSFTLAMTLPLSVAQADTTAPITILKSSSNVDTTVEQLSEAFTSRGMKIFTVIDHQAAARDAGLEMQAAKVIIYGAPKAGTPYMKKDRHFALQLPLKVLVTENTEGQTEVVFEKTSTLIQGSQISAEEVAETLAKAETLISNTVK